MPPLGEPHMESEQGPAAVSHSSLQGTPKLVRIDTTPKGALAGRGRRGEVLKLRLPAVLPNVEVRVNLNFVQKLIG